MESSKPQKPFKVYLKITYAFELQNEMTSFWFVILRAVDTAKTEKILKKINVDKKLFLHEFLSFDDTFIWSILKI